MQSITHYMPDINLHIAFDTQTKRGETDKCIVDMARTELKRELTKKERQSLFVKWLKAVNRYQLIAIDQFTAPLKICGGSVWQAFQGSPARYEAALKERFPQLSKKAIGLLKGQWFGLTEDKRKELKITNTNPINGFTIACVESNPLNKLMQKGGNNFKSEVLQMVTTGKTLAINFDHVEQFHFSQEKKKLKARLHSTSARDADFTHESYKKELALLESKRAYVLEKIKTDTTRMRNKHNNSGSIHVVHNAKGTASDSSGSRFTQDGYGTLEDQRLEGTQHGTSTAPVTKEEAKLSAPDNGHKLPAHLQNAFNEAGYSHSEAVEYIRWLAQPVNLENPLKMIATL